MSFISVDGQLIDVDRAFHTIDTWCSVDVVPWARTVLGVRSWPRGLGQLKEKFSPVFCCGVLGRYGAAWTP